MKQFLEIRPLKGADLFNHLRRQLQEELNRLIIEGNNIVIDFHDAWWFSTPPMRDIDACFYACLEAGKVCRVRGLEEKSLDLAGDHR
ncbi:MAG: hypothetical protein Kow0060_15900 [Methylohalobius crimeensis]